MPCPAITAGSSNAGTNVAPVVAREIERGRERAREVVASEDDLRFVHLRPGDLRERGVGRHDDRGRDCETVGVVREPLGMVAGRRRDHAGRARCSGEREQEVEGAALLERRGELEVLELQPHPRTGDLRQRLRRRGRGGDHGAGDRRRGRPDVVDRHGERHVGNLPPSATARSTPTSIANQGRWRWTDSRVNVRHQGMGVFFVHIMKTGGTSVSRLLVEHFGEKAIYPPADAMGPTLDKMKPSELLDLPPERREHIQVYSVHMPAWVANAVAPDFCTFTVLREPVARTVSHLRQAASTPWAPDSLEAIWDDPTWRLRLVDYQTRFFAGDERDVGTPDELAPSLQAFQAELARTSRASGGFAGVLRPYFVTGVPYATPLPDDAEHRARAQLASIDVVGVTEALESHDGPAGERDRHPFPGSPADERHTWPFDGLEGPASSYQGRHDAGPRAVRAGS